MQASFCCFCGMPALWYRLFHLNAQAHARPAAQPVHHIPNPSLSPAPIFPLRAAAAVALPSGRVVLLLRCRVYDGQGRTYTLQHACLFHLQPSPAGEAAGMAAGQAPYPGLPANASAAASPQQAVERQQMRGRQLAAGRLEPAVLSQPQEQQLVLHASDCAPELPAAARSGLAGPLLGPMRLIWQGFVEMPGGGNK